MDRQMVSPIPVPVDFVVKNGRRYGPCHSYLILNPGLLENHQDTGGHLEQDADLSGNWRSRSVTEPIASIAFIIKFTNT